MTSEQADKIINYFKQSYQISELAEKRIKNNLQLIDDMDQLIKESKYYNQTLHLFEIKNNCYSAIQKILQSSARWRAIVKE